MRRAPLGQDDKQSYSILLSVVDVLARGLA